MVTVAMKGVVPMVVAMEEAAMEAAAMEAAARAAAARVAMRAEVARAAVEREAARRAAMVVAWEVPGGVMVADWHQQSSILGVLSLVHRARNSHLRQQAAISWRRQLG